MLTRNTCETCTQCLIAHKNAKLEKINVRRINIVDKIEQQDWHKDLIEIERINEEITLDASWKFKILYGIVRTEIGNT